jgi:hypothetical protein
MHPVNVSAGASFGNASERCALDVRFCLGADFPHELLKLKLKNE